MSTTGVRDPVPRCKEVELPLLTAKAGDLPGVLGSAFLLGSIQGCWLEYKVYANPQVTGDV